MQDYHELPKLRDSLSYVYVEHAIVQRYQQAIEVLDQEGETHIPVASLCVLMLGPGTRITHGAVKLLCEGGCHILWVGEDSTRFYAQGSGETRKGYRLLKQAELAVDPLKRTQVVLNMYRYRFGDDLDASLTIEQIRGHEGARVRTAYQHLSRRFGVEWEGRRYDRNNWGNSDPINRAISAANALLNGLCHAAIVSGGYSPGLGFIHTGKQLSFVYDVADLYKTDITIPIAFEATAQGSDKLESRVRQMCRERFREEKLLQRILPDIDRLLSLEDDDLPDFDEDGAMPGALWDESQPIVGVYES
jgi:CRISPR-associated protein Cas1